MLTLKSVAKEERCEYIATGQPVGTENDNIRRSVTEETLHLAFSPLRESQKLVSYTGISSQRFHTSCLEVFSFPSGFSQHKMENNI